MEQILHNNRVTDTTKIPNGVSYHQITFQVILHTDKCWQKHNLRGEGDFNNSSNTNSCVVYSRIGALQTMRLRLSVQLVCFQRPLSLVSKTAQTGGGGCIRIVCGNSFHLAKSTLLLSFHLNWRPEDTSCVLTIYIFLCQIFSLGQK